MSEKIVDANEAELVTITTYDAADVLLTLTSFFTKAINASFAGEVSEVINYNPDGTVESRQEFAYQLDDANEIEQ